MSRKKGEKRGKKPEKRGQKPAYTPKKGDIKKKREEGRALWQLLKMKDDEVLEELERAAFTLQGMSQRV